MIDYHNFGSRGNLIRPDVIVIETPSQHAAPQWLDDFEMLRGHVFPVHTILLAVTRQATARFPARPALQWAAIERAFAAHQSDGISLLERIELDGWQAALVMGGEFSLLPVSWAAGGSWLRVRLPGTAISDRHERPLMIGDACLSAAAPLAQAVGGGVLVLPPAAFFLDPLIAAIPNHPDKPIMLLGNGAPNGADSPGGSVALLFVPARLARAWVASAGTLAAQPIRLPPSATPISLRRPQLYAAQLLALDDPGNSTGRAFRQFLNLPPTSPGAVFGNRPTTAVKRGGVVIGCSCPEVSAAGALAYGVITQHPLILAPEQIACDLFHPREGRLHVRCWWNDSPQLRCASIRAASGLNPCAIQFLAASANPTDTAKIHCQIAAVNDGDGNVPPPALALPLLRMRSRGDPLGVRWANADLYDEIEDLTRRPMIPRPDNFTPIERTPWGGTRIANHLKPWLGIAGKIIGESWEISAHPSFPNQFATSADRAVTLPDIITLFPGQVIGSAFRSGCLASFPILIKILDAQSNLSVQVHPPDGYDGLLPEESGKIEAWHILAAQPGAGLFLGLQTGVSPEIVRREVESGGRVDNLLNFIEVNPGETFLIRPGTLHAIGAGITLIEIQQTSEVTYRLWDWNRKYDARGCQSPTGIARPLHVDHSLTVADFSAPRGQAFIESCRSTEPGDRQRSAAPLIDCKYFHASLTQLQPRQERSLSGDGTFIAVTVLQGAITIHEQHHQFPLQAVRSFLIPARVTNCVISTGDDGATLLLVRP